jgi:predicted nucleic acid-binding protein
MVTFVVDSSVAAAWCFPDERTNYTNAVLRSLSPPAEAVAPRLFAYEVRNSVLMGLRRKRITKTEAETFLNPAQSLPIRLEDPESYDTLFQLADRHGLTVYDAAYLDMAIRKGLPLATLDTALAHAAGRSGVVILQP